MLVEKHGELGGGAMHGEGGVAAADGAAAAWLASDDASRPSTTSPDRANGAETFGRFAVEAIVAKNCSDASGVSGPWLEEAKLKTESPGISETWVPLMLSTARGLPIDAAVCICVREGVPRAPPNSRTSAGVLPSAQDSPSPPAWDIRGRALHDA